MMKKPGLLIILGLLIVLALVMRPTPEVAPYRECGVTETVVLKNTTDAPVTHSFSRGTHDGFVVLMPGQAITVDVIRCK